MSILASSLALWLVARQQVAAIEASDHLRFRDRAVMLHVTAPEQPLARGTFQATQVADLLVTTCFRRRTPGAHVLRLKVYTPAGHLYQEMSVPFTGNEAARPALVSVADHPRPMAQRVMVRRADRLHVDARFPVGGTLIVSHSLYGSWTVDAFVDGATTPVARARFTLTP